MRYPWKAGAEGGVVGRPGNNIRANGTSQRWTTLRMLPESGRISRKMNKKLPSTRLRGGAMRAPPARSAQTRPAELTCASTTIQLHKRCAAFHSAPNAPMPHSSRRCASALQEPRESWASGAEAMCKQTLKTRAKPVLKTRQLCAHAWRNAEGWKPTA